MSRWEVVACSYVRTEAEVLRVAAIFCEVGWRVRVDGTWGTPPSNGGPVLVAERRVSS